MPVLSAYSTKLIKNKHISPIILCTTPLHERWWIHTVYAKVWYSALTVSSFIRLCILLLYLKAANTENGAATEGEKKLLI